MEQRPTSALAVIALGGAFASSCFAFLGSDNGFDWSLWLPWALLSMSLVLLAWKAQAAWSATPKGEQSPGVEKLEAVWAFFVRAWEEWPGVAIGALVTIFIWASIAIYTFSCGRDKGWW